MPAHAWWDARITGAFMSYWIYQHIGNLTAAELANEPMYQTAVTADGDVGPSSRRSPAGPTASPQRPGGRACATSAASRVLVVDSRAARVLDDDHRADGGRRRVGLDRRTQPRARSTTC